MMAQLSDDPDMGFGLELARGFRDKARLLLKEAAEKKGIEKELLVQKAAIADVLADDVLSELKKISDEKGKTR